MRGAQHARMIEPERPPTSEAIVPAGGPDAAAEIERLRSAIDRLDALASKSLAQVGDLVTLAWLRRITHTIDHLQASWQRALPPPQPLAPASVSREERRRPRPTHGTR